MEMRKGFYFSMDAVMALMIMSASMILVLQASQSSSTDFSTDSTEYRKLSTTGRDTMRLASAQTLNTFNDSYRQELKAHVGEEAMNKSVLNGISLLWANGSREEARELAKNYFENNIPGNYGFAVNISESGNPFRIYGTGKIGGSPEIVTTSSTLVSGHMINRSSTGVRARALLTEVGKNATKRVFMGGFVGQGRVTYNVSLQNLEQILNFTMEGDFSSPFDLYINGAEAGSYSYTPGNLTVDEYSICTSETNESRCEAFNEGYNNITFNFTGENRSVRGGAMKIRYKKQSEIALEGGEYVTKKKHLPGISGIINYYGGFYIPGELAGINAKLHYDVNNRTVFLQAGNTTIYQEKTDGENTVMIDNETVAEAFNDSEMSYDDLDRRTVPLRVGLGDISVEGGFRGAIADSVSVMDISNSMNCGFFEDPPCKIDEAIDASELFVETVLNASGNRAGFVSYNQEVVDSSTLTDDEESLQQLIQSQTASGNTCIGCGILEATDTILDPYIRETFPRGSEWSYTTEYLNSTPPENDSSNWKLSGFDDSNWSSGEGLIGSEPGMETTLDSYEGSVYLRKAFNMNHTYYREASLGLRSNDLAKVYINGNLVYNGSRPHVGSYWDREIEFNASVLRDGVNAVAVELVNSENDTEHWRLENSSEWGQGSFSGTEVMNDDLQLAPQFVGSPQDVDASQYSQISGTTTGNTFFWSWESYVDQVAFNGIDRSSGNNNGYLDATDRVTDTVVPGRQYNLNLTFQNEGSTGFAGTDYGTVFFDWDGDGELSDQSAVELGACADDQCTVSSQVKVPETAETGNTVMRVIGNEGSYHTDPTEDPDLGEAEDYSVYIDKPIYQNGSYNSSIQLSEQVNWSKAYNSSQVPEQTSLNLQFSTGSGWKESISEVGNSDNLSVRAQLNTSNSSVTPVIRGLDISYEVNNSTASFDAALNLTEERRRSMVVMSDGAPNIQTSMTDVRDHNGNEVEDAEDHTIEAACRAQENHDIKVYTVGFGDGADEELLRQTADCGGGKYYYADTAELGQVFGQISERILEASFVGQTVREGTDTSKSKLYPDSYLKFNYTSRRGLDYGRIDLRMNSEDFGGSVESPKEKDIDIPNGTDFQVPEGTRVESAKVTSYSGNRWTYTVETNGSGEFQTVFNLSNYGSNFPALGDPFTVSIPEEQVTVGTNRVRVDTALEPGDTQGGSPDNKVYYTLSFRNSVGYGSLFPNETAAQQDARQRLREKLDFNDDGKADVEIDSNDFNYNSNVLGDEPYLWGPANVKLVIWSEE